MTLKMKLYTFFFVGLLSIFFLWSYNYQTRRTNTMEYPRNYSLMMKHDLRLNEEKLYEILYWTSPEEKYYDWLGTGQKAFQSCTHTNCVLTRDKSRYNSSDVVLFYIWYTNRTILQQIKHYRPAGQRWIMYLKESPLHAEVMLGDLIWLDNIFNITWTYHSKSDIIALYRRGDFIPRETFNVQKKKLGKNYSAEKTKLVAALISNCNKSHSKRLQYIQHLQKYISVDIYGKCGTLKCEKHRVHECYDMLERDYKFYLSFENSICDEYITEKLWNIIHYRDMVPIVLGGGNYSKLLPPGSYIDIGDFQSPRQLAKYLQKVDKSDQMYNGYFRWRDAYRFVPNKQIPACTLCEYLNYVNESVVQTYPDMNGFWNKEKDCKSPENFYKSVDKSAWQWENKSHDISTYNT